MTRRLTALATLLALAGAAPLAAQPLPVYPNVPIPATGQFKWGSTASSMNPGGCYGGNGPTSGICVGPYNARFGFNTINPTGPTYDIFCVDFSNHVRTTQYTANFTNIATGDMTKTRLGSLVASAAQTKYKKAAWLASNFTSGNKTQWADIHGAIWNIMYGIPTATTGINTWLANLSTAEANNYNGLNFNGWTVITDVAAAGHGGADDGNSQEFLVRNDIPFVPQTSVPEPATLLLLGTGLLAALAVAGARKGA